MAAEDKNNIIFEIGCSKCDTVYLGESKRSLKSRADEHKRSAENYSCEKNRFAKHCWEEDYNCSWDQKKVVEREIQHINS